MIIYYLFFLFIILLCIPNTLGVSLEKNDYYKNITSICCLVFISFFLGLRDISIGKDSRTYVEMFKNFKSYPFHIEIGFKYLLSMLRLFSNNENYYMFVISIIINGIIVIGYYLFDRENFLYAFVVFFSSFLFYQYNLNIERQAIATGLSIIALYFLYKKKYALFIVVAIVSMTIHITSIIILFYPLFIKKNNRVSLIYKLIFTFVLLKINFMNNLFTAIPKFNWAIGKLQEYVMIGKPVTLKYTHFISLIINIFYFFNFNRIKNNKKLFYLNNFHVNYFLFLSIFHETIMIYDRFYFFLLILEPVILICNALYVFKEKKLTKNLIILFSSCYSIITIYFWGPRNFITPYFI